MSSELVIAAYAALTRTGHGGTLWGRGYLG